MLIVPVAIFEIAPLASRAWYLNNPVPHTHVEGTNCTPVPDIEAIQPEIDTSPVTDKLPPRIVPRSASVSFAKTLIATLTFLFVEAVSLIAIGVSLTQITVIVAVTILEPDGPKVSCSWNVKLSVPQKSAFGV